MLECEICGKQTGKLYEVEVEGATMLACAVCAGGRGVEVTSSGKAEKKTAPAATTTTLEIVENYGEVLRKAREAMGLPRKVLAEKISVKESTLARIEAGRAPPDEKTRLKLEKELGVKLIVEEKEEKGKLLPKRDETRSLWDAAEKKEKK